MHTLYVDGSVVNRSRSHTCASNHTYAVVGNKTRAAHTAPTITSYPYTKSNKSIDKAIRKTFAQI